MVDIEDIPDFPGQPGQRPSPGAPTTVEPVPVVLVTAPLDPEYRNVALNAAAVDAFIAAEITAGRALQASVERWNPWSDLQLELSLSAAVKYNYARFTLGGREWYGFLSARYENLGVTHWDVGPDVWTSYGPSIGYSFVDRSHVAVAASAAGDIGYCLEPEPFTPGPLTGYAGYNIDPLGTARVLVVSTTDLRADPFVAVDDDETTTTDPIIVSRHASGTITPHVTVSSEDFPYSVGQSSGAGYEDPFYYPYADGDAMMRPVAVGATPSIIDGMVAEGGAFIYSSVGAAITHLSKLAHTPWIADGIQRVILLTGGASGGNGSVPLSPVDGIPDTSGAPSYASVLSTSIQSTQTLAADWTAGLPDAYAAWTKLRTAPFSLVEVADRIGATLDYEPQEIGTTAIQVVIQGAFYPQADVAVWLVSNGSAAPRNPMGAPVDAQMSHYAVGRDRVYATEAAPIAANRAQSIIDMLTAIQHANADNAFTLASSYLATGYAALEAI